MIRDLIRALIVQFVGYFGVDKSLNNKGLNRSLNNSLNNAVRGYMTEGHFSRLLLRA